MGNLYGIHDCMFVALVTKSRSKLLPHSFYYVDHVLSNQKLLRCTVQLVPSIFSVVSLLANDSRTIFPPSESFLLFK